MTSLLKDAITKAAADILGIMMVYNGTKLQSSGLQSLDHPQACRCTPPHPLYKPSCTISEILAPVINTYF